MRSTGTDRVRFSWAETYFFLWFAQKDPYVALDNIESILNIGVVMPGDFLRGRDLKFVDAKARPFGVAIASLNFIKIARIL